MHIAGGAISFGPQSDLLRSVMNPDTMVAKWLVEVGFVADQSFGGQTYDAAQTASLYIGDGDYSTLMDTTSETLQLNSNKTDGTYPVFKLGFGKVAVDSDGDYQGFQYFIE